MKNLAKHAGILLAWLIVWQTAAWLLDRPIFLAGPLETAEALVRLTGQAAFWQAVVSSLLRIGAGFALAFFFGLLCGGAAYAWPLFEEWAAPAVATVKTIPVASFVILALIWTGAQRLSLVISFLVVFPMIYLHTLAGLRAADVQLLEMAQVFRVRFFPKIWHIYRPAMAPYLMSACRTALGMCWKSGVAAEVIGTPDHSIGEKLYMAKVFFSTDELFAWTAVVILLSSLFERLVLHLLGLLLGDGSPKSRREDHTAYRKGQERKHGSPYP